ncbi:MAG TPA: flagellar biosynthetic protein FliO [Verrucomicrobiae bacterium]|nr:flagellar biosynthetic protein FliO [Verrucomicrobiae bacterium]
MNSPAGEIVNELAPSAEGKPGNAEAAGSKLASFLNRIASLASAHRRERRLRLCEMLSLGEKRFIAVVEYGQEKFLLAGTPQNISLLRRLDGNCEGTKEAPIPGTNRE